jgi:lipopolysaccharide transport protein LptA
MKQDATRLARRVLLGVLLIVGAAVAWSLRRPGAPPPAGLEPGQAPARGTTVGDMSFLRFREGSRQIEVKAKAVSGREGEAMQLSGVEVSFPYLTQGRSETATITAEECHYVPRPLRATFTGNVHVVTTDGMVLDTDTLDYAEPGGVVSTDDAVRFKRESMSGSGRGLEYRAGKSLTLRAEVRLRFEDPQGVPTDIEAGSGRVSEKNQVARLEGGVVVRKGPRELRCDRLQLNLGPDLQSIERAAAIEDVDLSVPAGTDLAGTARSGSGDRRLRCRRLNVDFRSPGVLREAIAVRGAQLEVGPGPQGPRERRVIQAAVLRFSFDDQGRLAALAGLPARKGDEDRAHRTVLFSEPLPGAEGPHRRVESRSLRATFAPQTGQLSAATFDRDVHFTEPGRTAWAHHAEYHEAAQLLTLTGEPRVADEEQGSELHAQRIDLAADTQRLRADGSVRNTLRRREGQAADAILTGNEATLVCRHFEYDPAQRSARYQDDALLVSGKDELRAPLIVLEERAAGERKLTASGGMTSRMHPRPEKGAAREPEPVEARAREMVYEEKARKIVYTGNVEIRQGDILTLSPEAVVTLTPDGTAMDRLRAGAPVEVRQGARRATGERGTYTPKDETMVLTGEKVQLFDADRRMTGRILIFEVGSDRIRVDGQDETRTEAVFTGKEPPKP